MAISDLAFSKVWTNSSDFPTYEGSETKVREDLQYLYDEIKQFLNNAIVPALNALIEGGYAPSSVDTAAIQDEAVTLEKMAESSVGSSQLVSGSVTTSKLAALSVTQEKLALLCVGAAQLADDAVTTLKLVDAAVTANKIAAGSVSSAKLGSDILPGNVGFVIGTGDPMANPNLISEGQIYVKLES